MSHSESRWRFRMGWFLCIIVGRHLKWGWVKFCWRLWFILCVPVLMSLRLRFSLSSNFSCCRSFAAVRIFFIRQNIKQIKSKRLYKSFRIFCFFYAQHKHSLWFPRELKWIQTYSRFFFYVSWAFILWMWMCVREQELRFAPFCLPLINIILLIYFFSLLLLLLLILLLFTSHLPFFTTLFCSLAALSFGFCWVHIYE